MQGIAENTWSARRRLQNPKTTTLNSQNVLSFEDPQTKDNLRWPYNTQQRQDILRVFNNDNPKTEEILKWFAEQNKV